MVYYKEIEKVGFMAVIYASLNYVEAEPMTLGEWIEYRGWTTSGLSVSDNPDVGYKINFVGDKHEWWSPKESFDKHFQLVPSE